MIFKNKNKTEKPCHLNRVINKSFKLLVFLYLQLRGISECGGRQYTLKKEEAPRKSKLCESPWHG